MMDLIAILPPVLFTSILILLGKRARERRRDAKLGDMFLAALKDQEYRRIIIGMAGTFACAVIYVGILKSL